MGERGGNSAVGKPFHVLRRIARGGFLLRGVVVEEGMWDRFRDAHGAEEVQYRTFSAARALLQWTPIRTIP